LTSSGKWSIDMPGGAPLPEEEKLLQACLGGDEQAWNRLVERLAPVVWRLAWRLVGQTYGRAEAEDALQDVFVKLLKDDCRLLREYKPELSSLEYYITVIARSAFLSRLRGLKAKAFSRLPEEIEDRESRIESNLVLDAALGILVGREREIIELLFGQGLSPREVAEKLVITEATVRSAKRNALEKLREFFK
jgi:RNA polymerase sigma-70 factor (ECF subfamily)